MNTQDHITLLRDALQELSDVASKCDSWQSFPIEPIERAQIALAATTPAEQAPSDHAELRRLAMAATPGPWLFGGTKIDTLDEAVGICRANIEATTAPTDHFMEVFLQDGRRTALIGNCPTSIKNAEYIAAANPAAILALLDELDALRGKAPSEPVAWIVFAEYEGRMVPQYPATLSREQADDHASMYGQTKVEVHALYTSPTPAPHADEAANNKDNK